MYIYIYIIHTINLELEFLTLPLYPKSSQNESYNVANYHTFKFIFCFLVIKDKN